MSKALEVRPGTGRVPSFLPLVPRCAHPLHTAHPPLQNAQMAWLTGLARRRLRSTDQLRWAGLGKTGSGPTVSSAAIKSLQQYLAFPISDQGFLPCRLHPYSPLPECHTTHRAPHTHHPHLPPLQTQAPPTPKPQSKIDLYILTFSLPRPHIPTSPL